MAGLAHYLRRSCRRLTTGRDGIENDDRIVETEIDDRKPEDRDLGLEDGDDAGPETSSDTGLIYAIGDVHGRRDLLASLLAAIEAEIAASGRAAAIYFLGDVVDRGADSCGALDLVSRTLDRHPRSRLILGNHDDWFLSVLDGLPLADGFYERWLDQGGRETLLSYGADPADRLGARATVLRHRPRHPGLLRQASVLIVEPDFAFVHAGIDPSRRLVDQLRQDCLSIRAPFMRHVGPLERIVVHGHTPQKPPRPVATENRLSLDTGAYFSGVLTAAVIGDPSSGVRFLATDGPGRVGPVEPIRHDRGYGTPVAPRVRKPKRKATKEGAGG